MKTKDDLKIGHINRKSFTEEEKYDLKTTRKSLNTWKNGIRKRTA